MELTWAVGYYAREMMFEYILQDVNAPPLTCMRQSLVFAKGQLVGRILTSLWTMAVSSFVIAVMWGAVLEQRAAVPGCMLAAILCFIAIFSLVCALDCW